MHARRASRTFRALFLAALGGCATSTRARPASSPPSATALSTAAPDASAPAVVDASAPIAAPPPLQPPSPPTTDERERAEGSAVFMRVCGPCHMAMWHIPPGGTLGATHRSEASVRRIIREGSGSGRAARMPALGVEALPEREMPALFAWLRAMGVVGPP